MIAKRLLIYFLPLGVFKNWLKSLNMTILVRNM